MIKLTVDPENKDKFLESANRMAAIAQGALGWAGHARLWVDMNLDIELFGFKKTTKRIRRKRMKRALRQFYLQDLIASGLRVAE